MENRELSITVISVLLIIIGFLSMLYFENKLDRIGTYESINLLYMLLSQALCGVGVNRINNRFSIERKDC